MSILLKKTFLVVAAFPLAVMLGGCGENTNHAETGHGEEAEESSNATFKAGRGLQFAPEVVAALGLRSVEASERPLAHSISLVAQVYSDGERPRAVALVSTEQAASLKPGLRATIQGQKDNVPMQEAELVAISRIAEKAARQVELIFSLPAGTHAASAGETIALNLVLTTGDAVLTVPRSALLDAASGTFVYVVNGDSYLRTAVKIGGADAEYVEITDGLYTGDTVVAAPVNQLWLVELRLTKGGGHSH